MYSRMKSGIWSVFTKVSVLALSTLLAVTVHAGGPPKHWAATWATANKVEFPLFDGGRAAPVTDNSTLRQIVRISVGGAYFRVWLTNELGTQPLDVGAANLAIRGAGSSIVGSGQTLTFGGQTSVVIAAGQRAVSDPVHLALQ